MIYNENSKELEVEICLVCEGSGVVRIDEENTKECVCTKVEEDFSEAE